MTVLRLTVEEYQRNYSRDALEQLRTFAERELDNPRIAEEHQKIVQALETLDEVAAQNLATLEEWRSRHGH
jgi:DNA-binding FadR family transcriptional regulator